jgi:hypothetical protein
MMSQVVTKLRKIVMDKYIEESSNLAVMTVMDSLSIQMIVSMTVNGDMATCREKECSRRRQLEELKEDFINWIKP